MTEETMNRLILQKLEEYGDSIVEGKKKDKRKKERKTDPLDGKLTTHNPPPPIQSTVFQSASQGERQNKKSRKKKRKEKKEENVEERKVEEDIEDELVLTGHERKLREMSEQMGLVEFKLEMEKRKIKEKKEDTKERYQPEVVVFKSHKSKMLKKIEQELQRTPSSIGPDFDMREARYEVQKFGIKGFHGNQKEEAMKALLIKLGAKPPKNKCVNYKEYQETKKQQMLEVKLKQEMDRKLGYKIPKANRGKKRSRDRNDIGHVDGQVGMWKSGVQLVKKDDLKGFKKAKLK